MSRIWRELRPGEWQAITMPEDGLVQNGLHFLRYGAGNERGAALLLPVGIVARVNGRPVLGGLRVLDDKDEVTFGRSRFFYSAEAAPVVVAFHRDEGARSPTCPLCRGPVRDGDPAVQCPVCGRWFHQADKPCWTYAPTCRFCNHPTALDGATSWRPEMEEK
jgi:hypothetical protein